MKNIGEKLSRFSQICRSIIISKLNIHQNTSNLTSQELEILTSYAPDSDSMTPEVIKMILNQKESSSNEDYKQRLEYARLIINLLKQTNKLRIEIATLNEILIKSVLPKNERFYEIEQSLRLPLNLFQNPNLFYDVFTYEITTTINKQNVYIRCLHGQLKQTDINILSTENPKHVLSQINYNTSEKYSAIFDIEFKRVITSRDQLTIALPCWTLPEQSQQQIYIRCSKIISSNRVERL